MMKSKTKSIVGLASIALLACGVCLGAHVNQSQGIQARDADPSPSATASQVDNYLYQDEQINLVPSDGEVRVGRFNQKIDLNEFSPKLIPVHNVTARELLSTARQICGMEGGWAEVVQDPKKKQYFIKVLCPPAQLPYVEAAIRALDKEWLNATEDGTGIAYYRPKNRCVGGADFIARRYTDGVTVNPYSLSTVDEGQNSATHRDYPILADIYGNIMQAIDVPANEISVAAEFVEIDTQDDMKLGLDYIAWKNGPGRNLFELILAGRQSVERYRGASSVYAPDPPTVESLADDLWELLRGNSSRTKTAGRQRYASYNYWLTAAYIDFLKSVGRAEVLVRPTITTVSGRTADWSSMTPVASFVVTGGMGRAAYSAASPTYLRRVAFLEDILLVIEYGSTGLRLNDLDDYATIREQLNLGGNDINVLQRAADRIRALLASNPALLASVVDLINNSGLFATPVPITADALLLALQTFNGSGDLGVGDRYLNYSQTGQVGASLVVTPYVGQQSTEMDVDATIRSVTGYTPQGTPTIAGRTISSTVRTKDGEALVLAGLKRTEKIDQKAGAPFLSDIPGLGLLFGGKTTVDRTTDVVVTLNTTTAWGVGSALEAPDDALDIIADVEGQGEALTVPSTSFGFDQWLLDAPSE
ncbi:MAG TPA: hypothetical protein VM492_13115 [Sumerlaeia bacterium]|nr:hypothetical protein [Sumerlaeia bacterium]